MRVVVDGIIYQLQSNGGISRLYSEILPRMCDLDESLEITLLTEGRVRQALPRHARIIHRAIPSVEIYLRPGRMWNPIVPGATRLVRGFWIGHGQDGQIWHSTYYTQPEKWDGAAVVTVPDMIYERFPDLLNGPGDTLLRERKRRCVLAADAIICISETTREDMQQLYGIDPGRIWLVPLAPSDVFRVREKGDALEEAPVAEPFILYIGRRAHYKNFEGLIQAYSVWPQRKNIALVVVGQKWSVSEQKHLAELGIMERVHLLTDVDDERLCSLYNQTVAFIYPSLYEGFGIPLVEAMACGCPIVASRIASTIEVADDCVVYFDPNEAEELIAALDRVLLEGRQSHRCLAGLQRSRNFSWEKTALQTLNVYRKVWTSEGT